MRPILQYRWVFADWRVSRVLPLRRFPGDRIDAEAWLRRGCPHPNERAVDRISCNRGYPREGGAAFRRRGSAPYVEVDPATESPDLARYYYYYDVRIRAENAANVGVDARAIFWVFNRPSSAPEE